MHCKLCNIANIHIADMQTRERHLAKSPAEKLVRWDGSQDLRMVSTMFVCSEILCDHASRHAHD